MKTLVLSILTGVISLSLNAQISLDWAKNISTSTDGGSTTLDNNGNVFIAGYRTDTIILKKYNSDGLLINTLCIATNASSGEYIKIKVDGNNNVFLVGRFSGTTDFCPGVGVYNLTCSPNAMFLAKYSNDLNSLTYAVQLADELLPKALDIDNNNNIYVSYGNSAGSSCDAFVQKFDNNVNSIWVFEINATWGHVYITDIDVNDLGELFICGFLYNANPYPDFDPDPNNTFNNIDGNLFYAKYTTDTSFLWAKGINVGNSGESPRIQYYNNKLFLASEGSGDIDPNPPIFNMNGDLFVAQYYSSNGDLVSGWGREINVIGVSNEKEILDLSVNSSGDIFVGGEFEAGDSIEFDVNDPSSVFQATGSRDGFVAIYDFNNNYINGFVLETTQNSYVKSLSMTNNSFYVGGNYYGTTDFDPQGTYYLSASVLTN